MTLSRLKVAKRIFLILLLLTVGTVLVLRLLGVVSNRTVLLAFLIVELPSLLIVVSTTIIELRHMRKTRGLRGQAFFTAGAEEQPLLRLAFMEARTLLGLIAWSRGKRIGVDSTTRGFSYAQGTLSIPIAMGVVTIIEAGVIHLLIPWAWLRIVLLVASVYALILITGIFAARITHPHLVGSQSLTLKWGHTKVLETPLDNIASIRRARNHKHTEPAIDESLLVLTSLTSTNVHLTLKKPVSAQPPISRKRIPENYRARELDIYVAEPEEFVGYVEQAMKLAMWEGENDRV